MDVAENDIAGIQAEIGALEIAPRLNKIEGDLAAVDIEQLQGKLAELRTTLLNIMDQVQKLDTVEQNSQNSINAVTRIEAEMNALRGDMETLQRDMDDAWLAMDSLANPLR